jgi:hypothetical protein
MRGAIVLPHFDRTVENDKEFFGPVSFFKDGLSRFKLFLPAYVMYFCDLSMSKSAEEIDIFEKVDIVALIFHVYPGCVSSEAGNKGKSMSHIELAEETQRNPKAKEWFSKAFFSVVSDALAKPRGRDKRA